MPSSKFRKRYATLARTTLVTVNGHVIGRWTPIGTTDEVIAYPDESGEMTVRVERDRFNTRPFTPVPKKGR